MRNLRVVYAAYLLEQHWLVLSLRPSNRISQTASVCKRQPVHVQPLSAICRSYRCDRCEETEGGPTCMADLPMASVDCMFLVCDITSFSRARCWASSERLHTTSHVSMTTVNYTPQLLTLWCEWRCHVLQVSTHQCSSRPRAPVIIITLFSTLVCPRGHSTHPVDLSSCLVIIIWSSNDKIAAEHVH